jgi:N-acetylmuramoyl-L-alanine amidase
MDIQGKSLAIHGGLRFNVAMWGTLRYRSLACCVALAMMAAVRPAQAAEIKSARVWAGPDYTRVVFDLSGPLTYRTAQQDGEISLTLNGSGAANDFVIPAAQGAYQGLTAQRQGGQMLLTTRTKAGSSYKSFLLKPSGTAGYRLVLDIYPGQPGAEVKSAVAASEVPALTGAAAVTIADSAPADREVLAPTSRRSSRGKSSDAAVMNSRQVAAVLQGQRKIIVAIDPGHGGKDTGARGATGTYEKDVTLSVARNLAAQINRQPGMQAFLTRDSDFFIPLERRYQIAREHNADMFVSIHADAFINSDAKGSSVWVLSSRGKSNEAARWLADRENRADLIGGVSLDDKNDNLAAVLLDMQQGWAVQASQSIAGNVLKALGKIGPTHRGYVERANFVVLRSPDVPSILVETAFITNPGEERKLKNPEHQEALAQAVMGGIRNYFETTPPPGTWFAAQATRRSGGTLAAIPASQAPSTSIDAATPAVGDAASAATQALATATARRADADVRDLHRVGEGESLRSIAQQYGVSVSALKSANNISSNAVQAGAVLAIPAG